MKYTQEDVVKIVAGKTNMSIKTIHKIFCAIEDVVFDCLSSATPNDNVEVKPLKGCILHSKYMPVRDFHSSVFSGKAAEKIKAKAKITAHYNEKLNSK